MDWRGGHCYCELGTSLLSHTTPRCSTGCKPELSHTHERVGSRNESNPPNTWIESGQTPILREVSSSRVYARAQLVCESMSS